MKHLGLFEGIGGFSLAARWMGWETLAWCEWIEWNKELLKKRFPNAGEHGDITKTDFTKYANKIDIITGGFPCQPYSGAGLRKGKEDERHLWPEMLRAIREVSPRYVVGENVRGLTNWNGGMVFDEVQADLETQGYEVLPFLLPSCAKDYDTERLRIWFIAHSNKNRLHSDTVQKGIGFKNNIRFDREQFKLLAVNQHGYSPNTRANRINNGVPNGLDEYRLAGLGNAINPVVCLEIFKAIQSYEDLTTPNTIINQKI